jgi:flagellar basal-body rod protein FlgF
VNNTGNPLDLSLEHNSRAFFVVNRLGAQLLTRDGAFQLNSSGQIVTANGHVVVGANDEPITVSGQDAEITVLPSGEIFEGTTNIGQLKLVEVPNGAILDHRGMGLYEASRVIPLSAGEVKPGALEGSNVRSINELVDLIQISRDFEALHQLQQAEHSRIEDLIEKLPLF